MIKNCPDRRGGDGYYAGNAAERIRGPASRPTEHYQNAQRNDNTGNIVQENSLGWNENQNRVQADNSHNQVNNFMTKSDRYPQSYSRTCRVEIVNGQGSMDTSCKGYAILDEQ